MKKIISELLIHNSEIEYFSISRTVFEIEIVTSTVCTKSYPIAHDTTIIPQHFFQSYYCLQNIIILGLLIVIFTYRTSFNTKPRSQDSFVIVILSVSSTVFEIKMLTPYIAVKRGCQIPYRVVHTISL